MKRQTIFLSRLFQRAGQPFVMTMLMLTLLLTGCRPPFIGSTPTPEIITQWPTPPALPTRAAFPTQTTVPTPVVIIPSPTPAPVRLPGAYVDVLETALRASPGGAVLQRMTAGLRVGVLGQSVDQNWLQVRYQPDSQQPPLTGWVRRTDLILFVELSQVPIIAAVATVEETSPESAAIPATVSAQFLHLRAGPGLDQDILDTLTEDSRLRLVGRTEKADWVQVQIGGGPEGWVAARWLTSDADLSTLPVTGVASTGVPEVQPATVSGTIVLQTRNDGDIYITTGSGLQRLTYGFDPALSPDGSRIAFTRWDEPRGLWIINRDGSDPHRLIAANQPRSPTWTPDGQAIIIEHSTGETSCYDTPFGCMSGSEIDAFLGGKDCVTTPLGTFCRRDFPLVKRSFKGLLRANLNDGSTRDLPTSRDARAPTHHPLTDEVLYLAGAGFAITHDAGNELPRILLSQIIVGPAVYSPDGQFIYLSQRSGDHWDIWRYDSDGGRPLALTAPPSLRERPVNNVAPTVSPDGRTLLFLSDRGGPWEFWLMNSDGSNQRRWALAALAGITLSYDYANERMADWGP